MTNGFSEGLAQRISAPRTHEHMLQQIIHLHQQERVRRSVLFPAGAALEHSAVLQTVRCGSDMNEPLGLRDGHYRVHTRLHKDVGGHVYLGHVVLMREQLMTQIALIVEGAGGAVPGRRMGRGHTLVKRGFMRYCGAGICLDHAL